MLPTIRRNNHRTLRKPRRRLPSLRQNRRPRLLRQKRMQQVSRTNRTRRRNIRSSPFSQPRNQRHHNVRRHRPNYVIPSKRLLLRMPTQIRRTRHRIQHNRYTPMPNRSRTEPKYPHYRRLYNTPHSRTHQIRRTIVKRQNRLQQPTQPNTANNSRTRRNHRLHLPSLPKLHTLQRQTSLLMQLKRRHTQSFTRRSQQLTRPYQANLPRRTQLTTNQLLRKLRSRKRNRRLRNQRSRSPLHRRRRSHRTSLEYRTNIRARQRILYDKLRSRNKFNPSPTILAIRS